MPRAKIKTEVGAEAKVDLQMLQEALDRGDVAAAKEIAARIQVACPNPPNHPDTQDGPEPAGEPEPPRTKGRRAPRKAPSGPASEPEEDDMPPPRTRTRRPSTGLLLPGGVVHEVPAAGPPSTNARNHPSVDETWTAPARTAAARDNRVRARNEPMDGRRHVNLFDQWVQQQGPEVGHIDPSLKRVEKSLAKQSTVPRPGMPGARRPPAKKVQTYCDGCGRPFMVYPSEIMGVDGEGVYKCERCIKRGR